MHRPSGGVGLRAAAAQRRRVQTVGTRFCGPRRIIVRYAIAYAIRRRYQLSAAFPAYELHPGFLLPLERDLSPGLLTQPAPWDLSHSQKVKG
jgi:hypothetical protein